MRIVSYNVRYFGHGTRGIASTPKAMDRIAQALAGLDPLADIVCLQEVETASLRSNVAHPRESSEDTQLSRFSERLDLALLAAGKSEMYSAHYFPAHQYKLTPNTHVYTTGLAVLARRGLVIDHTNADVPMDITHRRPTAVRGLKQTRICAHVRFRDRGGQTVDVFNTHLSLPNAFSAEFWKRSDKMGYGKNQLVEAENVANFVDKERVSDRFVLVGDFNALPGSPVYEYFAETRGYRDAFAAVKGFGAEELRAWPTAGFMRLRMHLDHVFSGAGLAWSDFGETHPFAERGGRFHGLSDHVPLVGTCDVLTGVRV
jgi:endonuclease/exonuclease/phosphatase family metal-dependent hydrolase